MLVVLVIVFAGLAWLAARGRRASRRGSARVSSGLSGVPLAAGLGIGMAQRTTRRGGVVAGAIGAVAVAAVVSIAAGVLTASNDELQRDPQAYGQPWDAYVSVDPGAADALAEDLAPRDELSAVAVAAAGEIELPALGTAPPIPAVGYERVRGEMEPVVFAGRAPAGDDEVLLGTDLFDELAATIGGDVEMPDGEMLEVVGRGIIPIVGSDRPSGGVLLTLDGFNAHASGERAGEADEVAVAFRPAPGEDLDALLDGGLGPVVESIGSLARVPADVANLEGIGRLPLAVAAFTSLLAAIALAHALLVSERGHRRDVATWRALGMRRRATATTIGWAGGVLVVTALVVAVPLGVVVGRWLWRAIATSAGLAGDPVVPAGLLFVVVLGALASTALAAAWPARRVLRLRPGAVLRSE
jgi:FtsX-like permease family